MPPEHDSHNPYQPPAVTDPVADLFDQATDDNTYLGEPKAMPARQALRWLHEAWQLFKAQPVTWILAYLVCMAILVALSLLPVIGGLLQLFGTVLMQAGFCYAADRLRQQGRCEISDIFSGLQQNTTGLLLLSLIYILVMMAFVVLILIVAILGAVLSSNGLSNEWVDGSLIVLILLMLLPLILLSVVALYLSPALVLLHNEPPLQAVRLSLRAFKRNLPAALLAGLLMLLMGVLATIPLFIGWLLVGPMLLLYSYAVYRDLFFGRA